MGIKMWAQVNNGQIYAVPWTEYHVDCGGKDCVEHLLISACGVAPTAKKALSILRTGKAEDSPNKWEEINGYWFCPKCAGALLRD